MEQKTFYSSGKLLLSGEYLVLVGALALAMPVRFGQKMTVTEISGSKSIAWKTRLPDGLWFNARFRIPEFTPVNPSDANSALFIQSLLKAAHAIKPDFLNTSDGYIVDCYIDYDIRWGLGSSSALISNMAWWADIDPFELHAQVSKGSGYDVACARSDSPLLFKTSQGTRIIRQVDFNPVFHDNLYFVYLGRKQNTQTDVDKFFKNKQNYSNQTGRISEISRQMLDSASFDEFSSLIKEHELIMAEVLEKKPVKDTLFSDLNGEVKSLGAWGGDFVMVLWPYQNKELITYLAKKKLNIAFSLNEIKYEPLF